MALKLQKLALAYHRQFKDIVLDFTHPRDGTPLRRICFMGGNGTGKSTLLRLLWEMLGGTAANAFPNSLVGLVEFRKDTKIWRRLVRLKKGTMLPRDSEDDFLASWRKQGTIDPASGRHPLNAGDDGKALDAELAVLLRLRCLPDSELAPNSKTITDVPASDLNRALSFLKQRSTRIAVGQDTVTAFWTQLIALIKDREARLLEYQKLPENRDRTIREVEAEFLKGNPDILRELADFWNVILDRASLEFDYEGASLPIQLTDNLKAYIRLKRGKDRIPYAELSTGIRHFIFKLGHISTVFRGDPAKEGIILVDEPENSLHPDFLFDLVSHYERAAPGAQLFMATHSPIIAGQFKPEERFILEFDDEGGVTVRNGVSPEGDDPNDLLTRDFAVRTLYGKEGLKQWKRFHELDRLIQQEPDAAKRRLLMKEYMEIGRSYNFSPDEILPKKPSDLAAHEGLSYSRAPDRKSVREILVVLQFGFCAYSERYLKPLDSVEIEHFDPRLKNTEADNIRNWHAVLRWMNAHKARKIEDFLPLPDPHDDSLATRIRYELGQFVCDPDDTEARNLIEFLGVNRPEVSQERRDHVRRVGKLREFCARRDDDFENFLIGSPEDLSFPSALEAELGLRAFDLIRSLSL